MGFDAWNVVAAISSAMAALFALVVAIVSLRDARVTARLTRRREAQAIEDALQARLDPLYPGLRGVLGAIDDGIPHDIREVMIPFFVLYADAFAAHRDGLLPDAEWRGFGLELAFWAQRPRARHAWGILSQQEWTDGFAEYMAGVLSGGPAYPGLEGVPMHPPTIDWPGGPGA